MEDCRMNGPYSTRAPLAPGIWVTPLTLALATGLALADVTITNRI